MGTAHELTPAERFHPRVEADFDVKVLMDGCAIRAQATDLSMAGLKLFAIAGEDGDRLTLAIPLPDDREIVTQGTILRIDDEGTAVEFDQLDWEDMFALARYLHPRLP